MLQSVHFKRSLWTPLRATKWLIDHDIVPIKESHLTRDWIMFRIATPGFGRHYSKYVTDGVLFIFD